MDPDFFEVVMGTDGRLRFVPVTEQAHAEVTISSEKRARETSRNRADYSTGLCTASALACTGTDQLALELGQPAEHRQH